MVTEPLELEIVAAHLRDLGHEVDLVDLVLERRPLSWFVSRKPYGIVGLTGYINDLQVVKQLAREVKRVSPHTRVVVGGIHAEAVPTDFVDASIDHILWANGPTTIGEIASGMPAAEAACLPGVWGSGKARPAADHPRGLIPDRTVTARYRHRYNDVHHERSATLATSYGCAAPYGTGGTPDGTCAERPLDEVMDELATIDEPHVFIVDDSFLSRPSRIQAFCEALDARGISKKLVAYGRADQVIDHAEEIRLLAEHGLEGLFLGIDPFGDDQPGQGHRGAVEDILTAVRVLEAAGVQCYSHVYARADWGRADFDRLIDLLDRLEFLMVNIQPATPMPGTRRDDSGRLSSSRSDAERGGNALLAFTPTELPAHAYYWNLLRAHYRSSANPARRRHLKHRYGDTAYRRMLRGARGATWQYLKLMVGLG